MLILHQFDSNPFLLPIVIFINVVRFSHDGIKYFTVTISRHISVHMESFHCDASDFHSVFGWT